jgi:primosomal protein N' (replication factor Y)
MNPAPLFAEVILPLPVPGTFTYQVPPELYPEVKEGKRVVVQFGSKKIFTALIHSLHHQAPVSYAAKSVLSILDQNPVVNQGQIQFWEWISSYYMAPLGDVMNAAMPSGLKMQSESKLVLHPEFSFGETELSEKEYLIAEALENRKELTITDAARIIGQSRVFTVIKTLVDKNVVLITEELVEQYHPLQETFVRLSQAYSSEEQLNRLFDNLNKRAYKQLEILIAFIRMSPLVSENQADVKRSELIKAAGASMAQFNALQKKGVFETFEKNVSRLRESTVALSSVPVGLTEIQLQAYNTIQEQLAAKDVALLHGVTSSGKTEIYIRLIKDYLALGKQVLYLLPEIALTTQITSRLSKFFGSCVGVYHSRYNEAERVEIWNKVLSFNYSGPNEKNNYQIILGARSALFLPFSKLGLIIVDEEHDTSFKQQDPSPRYNARDSALFLARLHGAKALLGSATPALETYFHASSGKYGLVELNERFGGIQLPEIRIVNVKEERRQKRMKSIFSETLLELIRKALANQEQVILFQNRRGFSLRLECDICNWLPPCRNCDVTLIYHKQFNQLRCHYCGYSVKVPEKCPQCGNTRLLMKGFGTEKVEEELASFFPEARISRMDLDTTRTKNAYHHLIQDFEARKIDILVGTQMVTKGLDFDNVSMVAILNADNMITFPDFRSWERSFQLMAQVSGRAGRKNKRGTVIIQTSNPKHPVISQVVSNNYRSMFLSQIAEREKFMYPPFYRLVILRLKHKDYKILNEAADALAITLKGSFKGKILGPEYPLVTRIKNKFIKEIIIKLERTPSLADRKAVITRIIERFHADMKYKSVDIVIDVDPM